MPNTPNTGNEIDKVAKEKFTLPLWVVIALAVAANLAGVFLHV